jgi:hypothetical protein
MGGKSGFALNRSKWLLLSGLSAISCLLAYRFGPLWHSEGNSPLPSDFQVYWLAAKRWVEGSPIYLPSDPSPFKYSPSFAIFFQATFFQLSPRLAAAVWNVASVLAYLGSLGFLGIRLMNRVDRPGRLVIGVLAGIALSWHGFLETLSYGQADLFLGSAWVFIMATFLSAPEGARGDRGAEASSQWIARSLLVACILAVKPQFLVALLPLALIVGKRELLAAALLTAALYLAPAFTIGPQALIQQFQAWMECLRVQQDSAFLAANLNQSAASVLARWLGRPEWVGALGALGVVGFWLLFGKSVTDSGLHRRTRTLPWDAALGFFSLALAGYLLFSPLSWRWLTFLWVPLCMSVLALGAPARTLAPWAGLALLTQSRVSQWVGQWLKEWLGLSEPDAISRWGVPCAASAALFWAIWNALRTPRK